MAPCKRKAPTVPNDNQQAKRLKTMDEVPVSLFDDDDDDDDASKQGEEQPSCSKEVQINVEDEVLGSDVDSDDDVKNGTKKRERRRSTGDDDESEAESLDDFDGNGRDRPTTTAAQALLARRLNQRSTDKIITYNFSKDRPIVRDLTKSKKLIVPNNYQHQQALLHKIVMDKYSKSPKDYLDVQFDYSNYGSGIILVIVSVYYHENRETHLRLAKDGAEEIPPDFERSMWLLCMSRKEARKTPPRAKSTTLPIEGSNDGGDAIDAPESINEHDSNKNEVKQNGEIQTEGGGQLDRKGGLFSDDESPNEDKDGRGGKVGDDGGEGQLEGKKEKVAKKGNNDGENESDQENRRVTGLSMREELIDKALGSLGSIEPENVTRVTLVGNEQTRRLREEHGSVSVGVKYDDTLDLTTGQLLWFSQAQDNMSETADRILEDLRTNAADVVLAAKSRSTENKWEVLGTPIEGKVHEHSQLLIKRGERVVVATKKKKVGNKKGKADDSKSGVSMNQFKLHRPSPHSTTPKPYCAEVDGKKFVASDFSLSFDTYDGLDAEDIRQRREALKQQQQEQSNGSCEDSNAESNAAKSSKLKGSKSILSETRMVTATKESRFKPSDVCIYCGFSPASLWFTPHDDDVEHIKHVFFGEAPSKPRRGSTRRGSISPEPLPRNQTTLLNFFRRSSQQ